jgi:hypothetical protein
MWDLFIVTAGSELRTVKLSFETGDPFTEQLSSLDPHFYPCSDGQSGSHADCERVVGQARKTGEIQERTVTEDR